jgi:hypothetical protein
VSNASVVELLSKSPYERIRKQLDYLPHRKERRLGAIMIEAVRSNYSAPKTYFEHYYAKNTSSYPNLAHSRTKVPYILFAKLMPYLKDTELSVLYLGLLVQ